MKITRLIYAFLIVFAVSAVAEQKNWTWTVPKGVEKIKVVSKRGDDTVMNYTFNVESGQTFILETVE